MKPGRELDTLVAEKVFGHTTKLVEYLKSYTFVDKDGKHFDRDDPERVNLGTALVEVMEKGQIHYGHHSDTYHVRLHCVPHYSTDIAAAWQVVEKLRENNTVDIHEYSDGWEVVLIGPGSAAVDSQAETVPEAICLAALKAVE